MPSLSEIRFLAMKLPKASRMRLASDLFESPAEPMTAWSADDILAEAVRRDHEIESGAASALSLEEIKTQTKVRRQGLPRHAKRG